MALQFGVFDHIEPIPGQTLEQIYHDRLAQVEQFDAHGYGQQCVSLSIMAYVVHCLSFSAFEPPMGGYPSR